MGDAGRGLTSTVKNFCPFNFCPFWSFLDVQASISQLAYDSAGGGRATSARPSSGRSYGITCSRSGPLHLLPSFCSIQLSPMAAGSNSRVAEDQVLVSTLSSSDPTLSTCTGRSSPNAVTFGTASCTPSRTASGTGSSSTPQVQAVQSSSTGGGTPQHSIAAAAGSGVVCLVMEFLGGGSLQEAAGMDALYEDDGGVNFLVLWPLLVDVARGMGALHAMGMCHGGR